jgi:hypothetical protein
MTAVMSRLTNEWLAVALLAVPFLASKAATSASAPAPPLQLQSIADIPLGGNPTRLDYASLDAYGRVGIMQAKRGAPSDQFVADMIAPTYRPGHLAEMAMEEDGKLLACDSRADLIFQFDTRKRVLLKSWPAHGDGAGDMALDRARHRLFVGTRIPAEMTVYDSLSGREIVSLPGPETMDGVSYDADLKRIYVSGGRWYGSPQASPGWLYVYQQRDADHYELVSKIMTRPGSGTSLFVPKLKRLYVASQAIGDQEAAILAFESVP